MRRLLLTLVVMAGLAVACGDVEPGQGTSAGDGGSASGSTRFADRYRDPTATTRIDTAAILARYGFEVCEGIPPASTISTKRGEAIIGAAVDAGIAGGGGVGGDGYKASVSLFVLDDASLSKLARIAKPSEACVNGQDPNDYVAPGPQRLEGPGWHWIGAGAPGITSPYSLVTDQATYDRLWPMLGQGPETAQTPVDFTRQVILTITVGFVNFGSCGQRFDGVEVLDDGTVVLDLFRPGGSSMCEMPARIPPDSYVVALDLAVVGPPPLRVAVRRLPTYGVAEQATVRPGSFAVTTTTQPPPPPPPPTTAPPTVPPTAPAATGTVPTGQRSAPAFVHRATPEGRARFDVPVPGGWEAFSAPDAATASIVGRGGLQVNAYPAGGTEWIARVDPGPDLRLVAGPTAVAVPVYHDDGQGRLATTGETVVAQEYHYESASSFLHEVIRWYPWGDTVIVAVLGYPDPARVAPSLTGIDPATLMGDIRLLA